MQRDKMYPSQVASERPLGATRIDCEVEDNAAEGNRGGEHAMHNSERVDTFNRQLREGHAGRNAGEE